MVRGLGAMVEGADRAEAWWRRPVAGRIGIVVAALLAIGAFGTLLLLESGGAGSPGLPGVAAAAGEG